MTPFRVVRPEPSKETAVVVEVPHAGVFVDPASLGFMVAPIRSIGRDADLLVDTIFDGACELGATLVVGHFSRFVIDLNRGPDDFDGLAVEGGGQQNQPRGLIWRATTDGDALLARRLPVAELVRRRRIVYDPYHAALEQILDEKRKRFGFAIMICGHSMPSTGRRGHVDVGTGRADVVPGSRGRTTADARLIDAMEATALAGGFSVRHDAPYKGGFSTGHYGQPARGTHAVQIELARRLYMDEESLAAVDEGLERTRGLANSLIRAAGALDLRGSP